MWRRAEARESRARLQSGSAGGIRVGIVAVL